MAAAPLFRPGALPAAIVPSGRNAGRSRASVPTVVRAFAPFDFDAHQFGVEAAARLGRRETLL
jgi:hypothetical protein